MEIEGGGGSVNIEEGGIDGRVDGRAGRESVGEKVFGVVGGAGREVVGGVTVAA